MGSRARRPTATARLLTLLHLRGPQTRAAATAELGLTRTAVGDAVAELSGLGLLRTGMQPRKTCGPPDRGRPSPLLSIGPGSPVVGSVHLRPRAVDIAVIELGGLLLVHHRHLLPRNTEPERLMRTLAGWIQGALHELARPCIGVAVGLAGMVRTEDGLVRSSLHLGWTDVPAGPMLAEGLPRGVPVRVENDSALVALAEYRRGAGRGAHILLALACDHFGIGGALLGDGLPLPGTGHALEAGHIVVNPDGRACPCGQHGCLELYADGRALLRAARLDVDDPVGVVDAAERGDSAAVAAVATVGEQLGIGLATLVNVLGPDRVVLAGLLGRLYAFGPETVRARLATSHVARVDRPELVGGTVRHPVLVGAGELAFERLLRGPSQVLGVGNS